MAPYSPQQNVVVERWNHTTVEMARRTLKSMQVTEMLWGEAVRNAVYNVNRATKKSVDEETTY